MVSEIDLLREDIPRLEKKFGVGSPFVEVGVLGTTERKIQLRAAIL